MPLPRDGRDDHVGVPRGLLVAGPGELRRLADGGRRGLRAGRVTGADDDPVPGQGQPPGQAPALVAGAAQHADHQAVEVGSGRGLRGSHPLIL